MRNSIFLGAFSLISIVLGVFRDRLLAHYVGVGQMLDIYNASFRLPDLLFGCMLSFVASATVIPFISKGVHAGDHQDTSARMSTLFFFFSIAITLLAIILACILPYIARYIVPGFSNEATEMYIHYTRLLLVQPLLLGISSLISALAQVKHQFLLYSVAPLFYTLGIILGIIFLYTPLGIEGIFIGVLLGAAAHLAIQSITLYRQKVLFSWKLCDKRLLSELVDVAAPRSLSYIVTQIRIIGLTAIATLFGTGALSIYLFAQRIQDACTQLISQSISTAILPSLSAHVVKKESALYNKKVQQSAVAIFVLSSFVGGVIFLFSRFFVLALYGDTGHTEAIASLVRFGMISLPLYALCLYFGVALSSLKDTKTLLYANISSSIAGIILMYTLYKQGMGFDAVGYAILVAPVVYLVALFVLYRAKQHTYFT